MESCSFIWLLNLATSTRASSTTSATGSGSACRQPHSRRHNRRDRDFSFARCRFSTSSPIGGFGGNDFGSDVDALSDSD